MSFLLKHYVDPDWDPSKLTPQEQADGSVDHTELNFVQSFSAGDLIAEWVDPDESGADDDSRFLFDIKASYVGIFSDTLS